MRYQGRLTNWNDGKGYGFVTPNGGGDRAFVHISAFLNKRRRPVEGDLITYAVAKDSRNRFRAEEVRYPGQAATPARASHPRYAAVVVLLTLFFGAVFALMLLGEIHFLVPFAYVILSCIAFLVYGFDKAAALNGRWRTQEVTLHVLSLLGGWPGALLAQQMFRHKSQKLEFQVIYWLTVLLNCAALAWSLTQDGASVIRTMTLG